MGFKQIFFSNLGRSDDVDNDQIKILLKSNQFYKR